MLNNVMLVGRISGIYNDCFTIKIPNQDINHDPLECRIFASENIMNNIKDYVNIDDVVGVRGKLDNKGELNNLYIIADKISFLSSKNTNASEGGE